ncbi:MAG: GIY-YIG nuclease family protein [Acidobacteriota bacterium]
MTAAAPLLWHVYIIRCHDGSLYTGVATDVSRRLAEHRQGDMRGAKYLRGRGPLDLVLSRPVGSRSAALRIEAGIKGRRKARKEELLRRPEILDDWIETLRADDRGGSGPAAISDRRD